MSENEIVLIIDDQRDTINFLRERVLNPAGYDVSVAYDGEQGLHKALEENPDLIIVNLTVPRVSGLQVLQELRAAHNDVPVILTTFHGAEEAAVRAFQLRAQDYIIKPYTVQEMQQAIERSLIERRLRYERDQLASNITQANRQMERRIKELNVLASIGKSITALLDEDRLLKRVVEAAVYITGAEEGILFLVDKESGELYMRAARGFGEKYARGWRVKVNDSLTGQVVQTGKPIIITSSQQEDRLKLKTGYLVRSLLHVPVKVGEAVIGVLSVDHMVEARTFTNHDLYLLSTLADYTAIALENARLHTRLQRQLEEQRAEVPVFPPEVLAAAQPEATEEVKAFLASLGSHRDEVQICIQAGKTILSELRERAASLETYLDEISLQEQSLDTDVSLPGTATVISPSVALEQELNVILDSMMDGVLVVDQHDLIVLTNQAAETLLGSGLIGKTVDDVCDDPRWSKTYRIVKAAAQLSIDKPGSELTSATTPLGVAQKMLRASFRVRLSAGQVPPGVVIVLRDITAEREARRARDSFISSVSQELRTPMTSILGYADLLLSRSVGRLGETQTKFLNRIRSNAERVDHLLNDLVGMMSIDTRQLEIRTEIMDLVAAIHEASDAVRAQMAEREQVLELDLDLKLPYIQAGPDAVYHILTNLLQNAHRCSPEKAHIVLHAEKMLEDGDVYVAVSITDTGGGIAPKDSKKVFNRFYRSDDPIVPGLGDPGVNLPIVKVLVEANGGRIWLDSIPGVGSAFTFILPAHHDS